MHSPISTILMTLVRSSGRAATVRSAAARPGLNYENFAPSTICVAVKFELVMLPQQFLKRQLCCDCIWYIA